MLVRTSGPTQTAMSLLKARWATMASVPHICKSKSHLTGANGYAWSGSIRPAWSKLSLSSIIECCICFFCAFNKQLTVRWNADLSKSLHCHVYNTRVLLSLFVNLSLPCHASDMALTSNVAQMQPSTPSKHDEINSYFIRLNRLLPETSKLRERSKGESPSERHATKKERCQDQIIYCFWKARAELDLAIETFEARLKIKMPTDPILYLLKILPDPASTTSFRRPTNGRSFQQPSVPRLHINQPARLKRPTTPIVSDEDEENFDTPPETPTRSSPSALHLSSSKKRTYMPDDQAAMPLPAEVSFTSSRQSNQTSFTSTRAATSFGLDGTGDGIFSVDTSIANGSAGSTSGRFRSSHSSASADSFGVKRRKLDSQEQKVDNSHFQIRGLRSAGLFCDDDFPKDCSSVPIHQVIEGTRLALMNGLPPYSLLTAGIDSYEQFYKHCDARIRAAAKPTGSIICTNREAFSAAARNEPGVMLKMRLDFTSSPTCKLDESMFRLSISPLTLERSDPLRRGFGWDRFACLDTSAWKNRPDYLKREHDNFKDALNEWLNPRKQKKFLGRVWNVINVKYENAGKKAKNEEKERLCRVLLFASSGCNLTSIPLKPWRQTEMNHEDVVKWFLPLHQMQPKGWAKSAARMDLALTPTIPTIEIPPSQVRESNPYQKPEHEERKDGFGKDIYSDGSDDTTGYHDQSLAPRQYDKGYRVVMNDGCARISLGAIQQIVKIMKAAGISIDGIPTAFQARFNGAKGVWHRSCSLQDATRDDWDVWIEITPSQRKFPRHLDDTDDSYDPERWRFGVVRWTTTRSESSALNLAFIPILKDRGVKLEVLEALAKRQLRAEEAEVLEALSTPQSLLQWLHRHFSLLEKRHADGTDWSGGMPVSDVEKLVYFVQHGMFVEDYPYLSDLFSKIMGDYFHKVVQSMSIKLSTSTFIFGIADPFGVLEPGEIYCQFSTPLMDEHDSPITNLEGRKVLAARHPSLIASDMQAFKAVWHPKFRDFPGVVIFSSKGQEAGAAKLQGGDYDGDEFWLCWEPSLTHDFVNAPTPYGRPEAEHYGITVDRATVADVMGPEHSVSNFIHTSLKFRGEDHMLGQVTKQFERMAYEVRDLHHPGVEVLAAIHHSVIDSVKGGLHYTDQLFKKFVSENPDLNGVKVPKQTKYETGMDSKFEWKGGKLRLQCDIPKKLDHCVDKLFFAVIVPQVHNTLDSVMAAIFFGEQAEVFFEEFFDKNTAALTRQDKDMIMTDLDKNLGRIRNLWNSRMNNEKRPPATTIRNCFNMFHDLQPDQPEHEVVKAWLDSRLPGEPTTWLLIKAARLYMFMLKNKFKTNFMFHVAGRQLAYLKAMSFKGTEPIITPIWTILKPGKVTVTTSSSK